AWQDARSASLMVSYSEVEDVPIPLVRRRPPSVRPAVDVGRTKAPGSSETPGDRVAPAEAGGIVGFGAGAAWLAVVHGVSPAALARPLETVSAVRGVDVALTYAIAYATAAAVGALVGAAFAVVTRYLRKWLPLLVWAQVFFVSLAVLFLALRNPYGPAAA